MEEASIKYKRRRNGAPSIMRVLILIASSCRKCWLSRTTKLTMAVSLLGALRLSHLVLWIQPPLQLPSNAEPWELPADRLQGLIMFKEESHALVESLLHLISQGFSHIRLVDNNSSRELPAVLDEFVKRGYVTLFHDKRTSAQKKIYFFGFQALRRTADWILTVDADEFPYATKMGSLLNYVATKDDEVCSIALPMRFFGASGRDKQPNSILQGFLHRRNFTKYGEPILGYKTVGRTSCTLWPAIHHVANFPSQEHRTYNAQHGFPRSKKSASDQFMEEHFPEALINHYRTQSAHFYESTKVRRGNGTPNGKQRTMGIFYANNEQDNEITDLRLSILAQQRLRHLYSNNHNDSSNGELVIDNASLALQTNEELLNQWPRENTMRALDDLARHQTLAILDAASGIPGQLGNAFRNAAILDPTWDCIVRVSPGHVVSVIGSGLTKLCATREAAASVDFHSFVVAKVSQYKGKYSGFMAIEADSFLPLETDTPGLRRDAQQIMKSGETKWTPWKPNSPTPPMLPNQNVWLVPESIA